MEQKFYYCQLLKNVNHVQQTQRKAGETLEFKIIKPKQTFHSKQPLQIKRDWLIGVTDLEVYKSIFKKTKRK